MLSQEGLFASSLVSVKPLSFYKKPQITDQVVLAREWHLFPDTKICYLWLLTLKKHL